MEKLRTAGVFDIEVSNMQIDNKYYILKFFLLNYRLKLDLFVFVKWEQIIMAFLDTVMYGNKLLFVASLVFLGHGDGWVAFLLA